MYPAPMETWKPQSRTLYKISVIVVLLLWLLPLIIIMLASFMTADQLNTGGRGLNLPNPFSIEGYRTAFTNQDFMASFMNSFLVVIPVTAISVCLATMAGYGLSKYRFRGQILIFAIFVGGNFVPFQILMVPVLRLTQDLGIYNTRWALILFHGAFQTGFCVFFMRNFIAQLPSELIEAARVEGANEWQIFRRIVLPLVVPAMSALAVLIFTFVWNDFFWSLVLTPASPEGMLAPAGLNNIIKGRFYNAWNVLAAGSLLVALPPVLMFFVLQKQFIAGLTLGANKG
ncbi:Binding-protein-dependent transport systems inner membrane component precursor [Candidatus Rhodobacter oscarellae]|uniref:Binding-protein-dependent transport systems inner membrane component n=1 Tax=Candidatus Rhodobacter oscarellae TaxID=1675527 RepID=A0A0J9GWW5_9RHOB|nr:carbohydrate ABC transporter permease [Candidatus Rhodobacter lobularis]KMW58028.1 Binding-protein-dependent transport systems inner membrane component precursor [Candidatus Rhodobacter lobularis]